MAKITLMTSTVDTHPLYWHDAIDHDKSTDRWCIRIGPLGGAQLWVNNAYELRRIIAHLEDAEERIEKAEREAAERAEMDALTEDLRSAQRAQEGSGPGGHQRDAEPAS